MRVEAVEYIAAGRCENKTFPDLERCGGTVERRVFWHSPQEGDLNIGLCSRCLLVWLTPMIEEG